MGNPSRGTGPATPGRGLVVLRLLCRRVSGKCKEQTWYYVTTHGYTKVCSFAWFHQRIAWMSRRLFLLMTILSQSFFTLVGSHFVAFSFLSAGHNVNYLVRLIIDKFYYFTSSIKVLAGLKAGTLCFWICCVLFSLYGSSR